MNTRRKFAEYSSKDTDNVETKKLLPIFKTFLEGLDIRVDGHTSIEEFEFRSRDGFSAFDHNRGGVDLIVITDNASLIGSGYHMGTSIEKHVEETFNETQDQVRNDNPDFTDEEVFDKTYEIESDEYAGQAFRVRLMYEGDGVLVVYAGWDHDAPYYRWSNSPELEIEIKFKNKTELKAKLKKIAKKIEAL